MADLSWRPYGRREPVIPGLDLVVEAGERVLLVGPSGCGKSTLLRAVAGLLGSAEAGELTGTVTIDGAEPAARAGTVGLVLQEPGAGIVSATLERDVAFGLENIGMPPEAMAARVTAALGAVGLDLPGDWPTPALSGGQTQRLALAGALALEPAVLLLDEPTAMLDGDSARAVRHAVDAIVGERGLTLVVVEHVLDPWVDLVSRLVVLDDEGSIVADGPVRQVLAERADALLDMGIWVPGAGPPIALEVPVEVFGAAPFGPASPAMTSRPAVTAQALTVTRSHRGVDGILDTRVAAALPQPLAPSAGELVALVGTSGSGKSTLLHALAGFLRPASGSVRTRTGADPASLPPTGLAAALAWVPQWASSTIVTHRVLDEVLVTARSLGLSGADLGYRARLLLQCLGLAHLAEADPRHLSGGELRRLAVASALLHGPDLVLADEPTVGQDRHTWAAIVGLLAAYRARGGTIVVATHDRHVIDRAGDVRTLQAQSPPQTQSPPQAQSPSQPGRRPPWLAYRAPLALLLGAALAVPTGILSPGWRASAAVLALQVVLAVLGTVSADAGVLAPMRALGLRLLPGVLAAVSVAWSTWLLGGHRLDLAANGLTRVLLIVLPSAALLLFVDTDRLGDALAQHLRLPDRTVVAVCAALHRTQSFGEIWLEISRARRVRGLGPSWRHPGSVLAHVGALTVGLLVRSLRAAADLAVAMDARGFAGAQRRTWWMRARVGPRDVALVGLALLPVLLTLWLR